MLISQDFNAVQEEIYRVINVNRKMGGGQMGPAELYLPFFGGGYNSAPSCTFLVFDPPTFRGGEIFFESTLEYEFHMSRKRISFQIFDRLWEFPPQSF